MDSTDSLEIRLDPQPLEVATGADSSMRVAGPVIGYGPVQDFLVPGWIHMPGLALNVCLQGFGPDGSLL